MHKALRFIPLMLVIGCAAPNYNYQPKIIEINHPPIGSENTAYIGDPMLNQGKHLEHDAILLHKRTTASGLGSYTFDPGYYLKRGEGEGHGFYLPSPYRNSGRVTKGIITDPFQVMKAHYNEQKICGISVFNGMLCTTDTQYEITKQNISTRNSFQQTLIYSGRIGDKITISYREFSDNMARPAFTNDAEYDISKSSTIRYKSAKIEILEATNELIRYRVISNFVRRLN